jgi:16S rRNA (guanine527-N7)-methyltransferase
MTSNPMTSNQQEKLETYQNLIHQYAKVLDLSSPRMLQEFEVGIQKALIFSELLENQRRVFDLGSGVGLPGIPLAILKPEIQITLCEIRQKRAAFLERCITQLKLENTTVFAADAKKYAGPVGVVTALWIGSLKNIYQTCQLLLEAQWSVVTIKGETLESEILELQKIVKVTSVDRVQLEDGAHLVRVNGVK